jgi:hypothetical protein
VKIKNQELRWAGRSVVELSVTYGSQPPVSIGRGAKHMQPGSWQIVTFELKQSIVQTKFCATVDSTNMVNESNENNNKLCGAAMFRLGLRTCAEDARPLRVQ